nr:hypothetical protein [Tanacetum cinerariifolium]
RKGDDHDKDPSPNVDKDPKKRQMKHDSYKDDKDQARSSNKGKSSSKPSKSNKPIDADEVIQDEETNTGECVKDAVRDSSPTAPTINKTKWFKQPIGIPIEVGSPSINVVKPLFGDNQDEGSIGTQNQNAANLEIVEVEDNATHQSGDGESGNSLKPNNKRKKKDAPKRGNPKKIDPFMLDMTGKMLTNESRIMARDFSKIEDENNRDVEGSQAVKDLRFDSVRLPKELVVLRDVARSLEDSHKVLAKEVERLHLFVEEVEWLHQKFRSFKKEKDTFYRRRLVFVIKLMLCLLVTQKTTAEGGAITTTISSPVTAKENIKKKNDVKARSTLLMALPNEHLMTFNKYKDAKSLFAAIETRFGDFGRLNKSDLDTMSIDDLYNNFKIVEQEVKGTASSNSSSQNTAFVSSPSTNSTNEVHTAYGVSTASTQSSTTSTQLAPLSMRAKRFPQKTRKKITINRSDTAGFDKSKVECYNCHKMGHFTRECRGPKNQDSRNRYQDRSRRTVHVEETPPKAMVTINGVGFDSSYMAEDEVPTNMALMAFSDSESCEIESKNAGEDILNELKEHPDAPLVKDRVLENKDCLVKSLVVVEKKIVVPTIAKVEVVRPKQQEKAVRKIVRLRPVNNARLRLVNTARPNSVVVNPIRVNQGHPQKVQEDQGYIDSGCSRHMTGNMSYLSDFKEFNKGYVTFRGGANGGRITGKGTIKTDNLDFEDVYFVRELNFNLFSVSQMCDRKNNNLFTDTECLILSPNFKLPDESQILLRVPRKNNMYSVDIKNIVPIKSLTCLVAKAILDVSMLWHRRLGHINFKNINKLVKDNIVRASNDKTTGILKKFITKIKNLVDKKVKVIRCDNGTEFNNSVMNYFCAMKGVRRVFSVARTPQQNSITERRNRTLIEADRTMALVVKPHNKTLYELFRGKTHALSFMRLFGCHVTILNTLDHLGKFDGKEDEGYFVGYSINSKAFRVYNIRTRRVEENLHIKFLENKLIVAGAGPEWLFDIDMLTESMNYVPVIADTNTNDFADKESEALNELNFAFENLSTEYPDDPKMPHLETIATYDDSKEEADFTNLESSIKIFGNTRKKHDEVLDKESKALNELNFAFENLSTEYPDDPKMPRLETIATYDDSKEEAGFTNLESSIQESLLGHILYRTPWSIKRVLRSE